MSMLILMTVFARKSDVDKVGHTSESRGPDRSFLVPCNVGAKFEVRADNHSLVALCQGYLTRTGNRKHLAHARVPMSVYCFNTSHPKKFSHKHILLYSKSVL